MDKTNLEIETFILKESGVCDLEMFASHHDELLVSITVSPGEAARWWHWQKDKCFPGEGWILIKLDGIQIMPMDAWTNVDFFWHEMLDLLETYVSTGKGEGSFDGEAATFSLERKGTIALFELRGSRFPVEPTSFLLGLLEGARAFFNWAECYVGGIGKSYFRRIEALENHASK